MSLARFPRGKRLAVRAVTWFRPSAELCQVATLSSGPAKVQKQSQNLVSDH